MSWLDWLASIVKPPMEGYDDKRTLIVPDVYPRDLDNPRTAELDIPPFEALGGLVVDDKTVAGCYVKATEGLGWGARNEEWFAKSWRAMQDVPGYSSTFFRGAYHFLRFQASGTEQAEYFVRIIERAGGWDGGELVPMLDIEAGGQGSWAPTTIALENLDSATKARLIQDVNVRAVAFVERFRKLTGKRLCIYGRGLFRDLGMTIPGLFGADCVSNPAYTRAMPRMNGYGVPLEKIALWQLCGDGQVVAAGFPSLLPGWGRTDYSVHINGTRPTSWRSFYKNCLAVAR